MPSQQYGQTFADDIERGDDRSITITAITPGTISGWSLLFAITTDAGVTPVLSLTVGNGVTITDSANGVITVALTAAQTKAIRRGLYEWGLYRTDSGNSFAIATGSIRFIDPKRTI